MGIKLQTFIHNMEMGAGGRVLRMAVVVIAMAAMAVAYNLAAFKNLATEEGMDAAQLARNIAEGRGYTTYFVRPLSLSRPNGSTTPTRASSVRRQTCRPGGLPSTTRS